MGKWENKVEKIFKEKIKQKKIDLMRKIKWDKWEK